MTFAYSLQAELLKSKRTASFWLTIMAAALMPTIFTLAYFFKPEGALKSLQHEPWKLHFTWGWQALCAFIFPMYVILICTLTPQVEYKNNTWKQVFASPQSIGTIYFSKFLTLHLMIFFFYSLFSALMILSGVITNLLNDKFTFLAHSIDWQSMVRLSFKMYLSILGISAIQYWLSFRIKNFIAPIGIGLAFLVTALMAREFGWEYIDRVPFAHPLLTLETSLKPGGSLIAPHEWNSIIYFIAFLLVGYADLKFRKEKG